MLSRRLAVLGLILIALGAGGYALWRSKETAPIIGVVRTTEVRAAPEVGGQLATVNVQKGSHVRAGDVVAQLSAIELSAAVVQARAALDAASAQRDHVYAGVRAEEVAALASAIGKAKSSLDQAEHDIATARADVAEADANHAAAVAGPTREERAIADAQVKAAATALAVLERRLEKTTLRAPADGVVIAATDKQWLSFNAGEDLLHGLTVGDKVVVARAGGEPRPATVTELTPLRSE